MRDFCAGSGRNLQLFAVLAMVRLASSSPSRWRIETIFESLGGLRGSSASMIFRMRCLIVTDETLSILAADATVEK